MRLWKGALALSLLAFATAGAFTADELGGMRFSALEKLAHAEGIPADQIDEAMNNVGPKKALVALLTNMPVCSSPVDCKVTSWVSPLGVPSADFSTVSFVLHHRIHYRHHNRHCHCGTLATSPDAGIHCPLPTPTGLGRA